MGNPFYADDKGVMCFNPAKTFQIANGGNSWYNEKSQDTIVWDSGTSDGTHWTGKVIGIADYNNNPDARPVVVKIESGGPNDLFVGFNRAKGINKDTADAQDLVTVHIAENEGLTYAKSVLEAILAEGESFVVDNWRNSSVAMTIFVKEINLDANPGYADVVMTFGSAPTNTPTYLPTPIPTTALPTHMVSLCCIIAELSHATSHFVHRFSFCAVKANFIMWKQAL